LTSPDCSVDERRLPHVGCETDFELGGRPACVL
jgi:hypothetical protein